MKLNLTLYRDDFVDTDGGGYSFFEDVLITLGVDGDFEEIQTIEIVVTGYTAFDAGSELVDSKNRN